MKKLMAICLCILVLFLCGCTEEVPTVSESYQSEKTEATEEIQTTELEVSAEATVEVTATPTQTPESSEVELEENLTESETEPEANKTDSETVQAESLNPYFFAMADELELVADGKYEVYDSALWQSSEVGINVYKVKEYELGTVYRMTFNAETEVLEAERLNIYFYVQPDKIYRLWSYVYSENDGTTEVISFYEDDELLTATLDTDQKLIDNGELVCQEESISSDLEQEEAGMHYSLSVGEGVIEYHSYDINDYGNTGFYEYFTWQDGQGLIEYGSGYRAESEILYLENIRLR